MSTAIEPGIATGNWQIDKVHSHLGFAVKHMVVATFRGGFDAYDGSLTVADDGTPRLEGWVEPASVAVRDENLAAHLQSPDFFDTAVHPRITFASTSLSVSDGGEVEVEGELTIKGNTRPVSATGTISGPHVDIAGNEKLGVTLETVIDRREYGLEWNAPLPKGGFALDNDVKIEVELELVKEA
jgi:polyisoprenoid-binding protein YceI